jgi:hypothetical protein
MITGFDLFPALGGSRYPWSDGRVIGLGVCFGVCLLGFIAQQYWCILTTPTTRLFPSELLRSWELCLQFVAMTFVMFTMIAVLYTMPLQLQFVFGDSILISGVKLLPYIFALAISAMASGIVQGKKPFYMAYYLLSGVLILTGSLLLRFSTPERGWSWVVGVSVLAGSGCGISTQLVSWLDLIINNRGD